MEKREAIELRAIGAAVCPGEGFCK